MQSRQQTKTRPSLGLTAIAFAGKYAGLNGKRSIGISKRRVIKFAVNIGMPILRSSAPTSSHAGLLASYKALATKCAIDFSGAYLRRPPEYVNMDQSEKANISYWTGMTFAALAADELLGVPRLIHAGVLKRKGSLRASPVSRRLADLIGQDGIGNWHVVEAKARQNCPTAQDRSKWKKQARTVLSINGTIPATNSYSFTRVGQPYSVEFIDPPPDEDGLHVILNIRLQALTGAYYEPMLEWLHDNVIAAQVMRVRREGINLIVRQAAFDPVDNEFLFIGLRQDVMEAAAQGRVPERLEALELSDSYIGSDGIAVITSPLQGITDDDGH